VLIARASRFRELADAINITDGAGANCHMSSAAAAAVLVANGLTPVAQFSCRDRNRIALQGDILGAAALGVRNILCLTGDDVSQGDHPYAKPVFDLDSISLLRITEAMRDRGTFASGRKLDVAPNLFLGATANPFVPPFLDRIANLEKKIDAGAQFIQTQFCFDVPMLADFMRDVRARSLHQRCAIIVGVGTLSSAKSLRHMARHVPGVHIPESVLQRVAGADNQKAEAKTVLIETIRAVSVIEGVAGVHLMGYRNDDMLAEAIEDSGIRRGVSTRAA
jgi:5,10-methylenetetrahydrofolate reductase